MHRICESCFSHNLNSTKIFHFTVAFSGRLVHFLIQFSAANEAELAKKMRHMEQKMGFLLGLVPIRTICTMICFLKSSPRFSVEEEAKPIFLGCYHGYLHSVWNWHTKSRILKLFCLQNGESFGVGWGANFGKSKQTQNGAKIRISSLGSQFCK